MHDDGAEPRSSAPAAKPPAVMDPRARTGPPPIVDAEFRVLSPAWRLWRELRDGWWALGPYLAYCTALWGIAALVAWLMERGRG
jgi:hypothetical protein